MSDKIFIDVGILCCLFADNKLNKKEIILDILDNSTNNIVISTQVINEFMAIARTHGLSFEEIKILVEYIMDLVDVVNENSDLIKETIKLNTVFLAKNYDYSFEESKIIAAAVSANCKILLSETLEHGQIIGDLKIINPFVDEDDEDDEEQVESENISINELTEVIAEKKITKKATKATTEEILKWNKQRKDGMTWKEIAELAGRSADSVRNSVSRLSKK